MTRVTWLVLGTMDESAVNISLGWFLLAWLSDLQKVAVSKRIKQPHKIADGGPSSINVISLGLHKIGL